MSWVKLGCLFIISFIFGIGAVIAGMVLIGFVVPPAG